MILIILFNSTNNIPIIPRTKIFRESINYFEVFTLYNKAFKCRTWNYKKSIFLIIATIRKLSPTVRMNFSQTKILILMFHKNKRYFFHPFLNYQCYFVKFSHIHKLLIVFYL